MAEYMFREGSAKWKELTNEQTAMLKVKLRSRQKAVLINSTLMKPKILVL